MELARRAGNEPPLVGLIRVYKDYYPDVIVGQLTAGRASVFTVNIKRAFKIVPCLIIYSIQIPNGKLGWQKSKKNMLRKLWTNNNLDEIPSEL